jgi:hypothetical protein
MPKYRRKGIRKPKVPHKPAAIRPTERVTSYKILLQRCLSMGLLLENASSIKVCHLERALKHGDFPEVNQLVQPVSIDRERCSNPEILKGKAAILGPAYMTRLKHRSMIIRGKMFNEVTTELIEDLSLGTVSSEETIFFDDSCKAEAEVEEFQREKFDGDDTQREE